MKLLIVICLIAVVVAAPPPRINYPTENVAILRYENDNLGLGNYRYAFEQSDGTKADQSGQIKNEGREDESLAVSGSFQWIGPDGVTYTVHYTAGEEGYKPEIEQGPGGGVPPAVVASLLGSVLLIGSVVAAPPPSNIIDNPKNNVQILRYENNGFGKGTYSFAFEQSDGTKHEQQGEVKNQGLDDEFIVMRGVFSWVGPDGVTYTISYEADDNGYEPTIKQGPSAVVPQLVATLIR